MPAWAWPGWDDKRPERHRTLGVGWKQTLARQVWAAAFAQGRDLAYADSVAADLEKQLNEEEKQWDDK